MGDFLMMKNSFFKGSDGKQTATGQGLVRPTKEGASPKIQIC